ncbi:hypothetical protein [Arcticibacter eurypsychrophilus]|nr:hypothetical protein [Arcticibacter eurypsychrophilus]
MLKILQRRVYFLNERMCSFLSALHSSGDYRAEKNLKMVVLFNE